MARNIKNQEPETATPAPDAGAPPSLDDPAAQAEADRQDLLTGAAQGELEGGAEGVPAETLSPGVRTIGQQVNPGHGAHAHAHPEAPPHKRYRARKAARVIYQGGPHVIPEGRVFTSAATDIDLLRSQGVDLEEIE